MVNDDKYSNRDERYQNDKMDILFQVMDNENDVTLTDGKGIVLRVSDSYEEHYDVTKDAIQGRSVYDLEKKGVFKPSVTSVVLKERKKATIMQKNLAGHNVLTTGVPIFDEDGDIAYVISFNSIDIADVTTVQDKYEKLSELLCEYNNEINHLRLKDITNKELIAKSKVMLDICELISQVADTDANVLITGETGVGKSMIAKFLHESSNRVKGPFIEINSGTIPPSLIESELFGYEKGSFTGADKNGKIGKIELANKGTLFLDEIGELPLDMQIKFLQTIQSKYITKIGGLEKITVDFRLIAATNKDLKQCIKNNLFREDLYYRLNVIPIHVPPLRDRTEDIVPLVMSFLEKFNKRYNKNITLTSDVYRILEKQQWPGNIRQVENLIERIVVTAKDNIIDIDDLPTDVEINNFRSNNSINGNGPLSDMLEEYEKAIFEGTFNKYKTSVAVGKKLGISQTTAARKLRKYIPHYTEMKD